MTTDNRTNEPTPEQVEAAAKAIWERYAGHGLWETLPPARKEPFLKDARAALMAAAGVSVKNVDTSPERDEKGDDSLHDERVEAGARVLRERLFPGVDLPLGDSAWVGHAREVLLAADAVVTEEMIADEIANAWNGSEVDVKEAAQSVAMLFRGEVAGDE